MRRLRQGSTWGSQKWFWINFKSVFFPFFPTNVLFHLMEVAYRGIPLWRLSPCSVAPAPDTSSSRPTSPPGSVSTSWNPDEVIRCKIQDFTLRISRRAFTLFEPWQGSLQKKTTNVGQSDHLHSLPLNFLSARLNCSQYWCGFSHNVLSIPAGWYIYSHPVDSLWWCYLHLRWHYFLQTLFIVLFGFTVWWNLSHFLWTEEGGGRPTSHLASSKSTLLLKE